MLATITFSLFTAALSLNDTLPVEPDPFEGFAPTLEVSGDGTELSDALGAGTLGISVVRVSDGSYLRAPGPVDPSEVAETEATFHSTLTLDTAAGGHLLEVTLQPTEADGSPIGTPVLLEVPVDGGEVYAREGDALLRVEAVTDPTGDLLEAELIVSLAYPQQATPSLDPPIVTGLTGANVLSVATPILDRQTVRLGVSDATWAPGPAPAPGDLLAAEVDAGGVLSLLEAPVTEEVARVTRVSVSSTGAVEVDVLADTPDRVADVVVTLETRDASDIAQATTTVAAVDTSFAILLDSSALLVPPPVLARGGRRGVDMVVHSLDGTGAFLQSQLVTAQVAVTNLGTDVGLATRGAPPGAFADHLASPAVSAIEAELFGPLGAPLVDGPVWMDRSRLEEQRIGDLGRSWDMTRPTIATCDVRGPGGEPWDSVTLGIAQFGEILIDGVVWEVE